MTPMMRRAGMGSLGEYDPLKDPNYFPDVVLGGQYPSSSGGDGASPPWWAVLGPSIITTAGKDIQAVFGNQYQQQTIPRTSYSTPAGYYDSSGRFIQAQGSVQPGASVTTSGLNLFGAQIGWGTIALVGGVLFLIQMPGYARRR